MPLILRSLATLALATAGIATATLAQETRSGWRFGMGAGLYHIDELVGTPLVPTATVAKALGARAYVGLDVTGFFDRGRYGADFLVGDLDLGIRFPLGGAELLLAAGPSGYAGGDGDGTPYTGGGGQVAAGLTAWAGRRVGFVAKTRAHLWAGTAQSVRLGVTAGVVLRLSGAR